MTTKTDISPQQKLTLIKHLAAGKPAEVVGTIMHLSKDQVVDIARNHGYPDLQKLGWAADVLAEKLEDTLEERPLAEGPRATLPTPARPTPPAAPVATSTGDGIAALLNTGKGHESKRIQAAADKALDAIARVRSLIDEDREKNSEKRRLEAENAAARADVDRLEKQLAEAKAKLRGKATAPKPAGPPKPRGTTAPKGEYACRNDGCDRILDTPQGRSLHERLRCEHRLEAAS